MSASPVDQILEIFAAYGSDHFDEKDVTQLGHALQCATHAERAGESAAMITACLLHDIGHLINPDARAAIGRGEDAEHEQLAVDYLSAWFGDDVLQPIRWHVDAKRYLTATDPGYFARLSEGSVKSLEVQGGPYSADEIAAFEALAYHREAVKLRQWDEAAKDPHAEIPPMEHFRPYIEAALRPSA